MKITVGFRPSLAVLFILLSSFVMAGDGPFQFPFQDPSLSLEQRADDLVARLTLEEKIGQMMHTAPAIPRLGIEEYSWWSEALHGVARSGETVTVFPQAIALAATFDPEAVEKLGDITATEARAIFNEDRRQGRVARMYRGLTVWTPNINIFRDPRWGRGQETYGEDPFLSAQMGLAMVRGLQGQDPRYLKLSACAKHFAVHSGPESQRHRIDVRPSPYDLWDTYLPAFRELVVDGGVSGVMCAYNRFRAQPCCASDFLMNEVLRSRWKFSGYATSDCWALDDFVKEHKTHKDNMTAAKDAFLHGVDLECGGAYDKLAKDAPPGVYGALLEAVRTGTIDERAVDQSIKRLFTIRFRLGLFDPPEMVPYSRIPFAALNSPEHQAHALKVARESIVLLKNENHTLPLEKGRIKRIAVLGPNADDRRTPLGNYNGVPSNLTTPLEGITGKLRGSGQVVYAKGVNWLTPEGTNESQRILIEKLKQVDAIVFVGGISPVLEGEEGDVAGGNPEGFFQGDRTTIALPRVQTEFLKQIKRLGKPLILVVMSGSALSMEWEATHADAILQVWYGGQAGGEALADVLFGDYNPAGRLPVTFYRRDSDLPPFTDYSMANRTYRYFRGRPLYPYGHGLSYTRFAYRDLRVAPEMATGQTVVVSVRVKNNGPREGDEVVQLYVSHVGADSNLPLRSLQGFRRVHLLPGESRQVEFQLSPKNLGRVDSLGNLVQTAGLLQIHVGGGQPGYAATVSARVKVRV